MNTKSFTLHIAALAIAGVSATVHANAAELAGKVPVDFTVNGRSVPAGSYRIVEQGTPGVIFVKNDVGQTVALALLPVKSASESKAGMMTFDRRNGVYHLSSYCAPGRGCWSSGAKATPATGKIEIALLAK
jgi:hypothetical protein